MKFVRDFHTHRGATKALPDFSAAGNYFAQQTKQFQRGIKRLRIVSKRFRPLIFVKSKNTLCGLRHGAAEIYISTCFEIIR
jgi:hypothetical protein